MVTVHPAVQGFEASVVLRWSLLSIVQPAAHVFICERASDDSIDNKVFTEHVAPSSASHAKPQHAVQASLVQ